MGAWVATVLRDLSHDTGGKASSPPAPGTLPNFARGNNQIGGAFANAGMTSNFRVATANTGLTTTPPTTLGTLTSSNTAWWLALS